MTKLLLAAIAAVTLLAAACGGDGSSYSSNTAAPTATSRATTTSAGTSPTGGTPTAATPAATAAPSGATVEVTGIVGTVNTGENLINIQRLSGAAVRKISVDGRTSMRRASGGSLALSEIRPSDRIIAEGRLNDRQDTLLATQLTIESVVQGGDPGGG